jgi:hypothetical protein
MRLCGTVVPKIPIVHPLMTDGQMWKIERIMLTIGKSEEVGGKIQFHLLLCRWLDKPTYFTTKTF